MRTFRPRKVGHHCRYNFYSHTVRIGCSKKPSLRAITMGKCYKNGKRQVIYHYVVAKNCRCVRSVKKRLRNCHCHKLKKYNRKRSTCLRNFIFRRQHWYLTPGYNGRCLRKYNDVKDYIRCHAKYTTRKTPCIKRRIGFATRVQYKFVYRMYMSKCRCRSKLMKRKLLHCSKF